MTRRFLLFIGDTYHPKGGWEDFRSSHDTFDEAIKAAASKNGDWKQIVDTQAGEIVWSTEAE